MKRVVVCSFIWLFCISNHLLSQTYIPFIGRYLNGLPYKYYKIIKVNMHFVNHPKFPNEGFTETGDNLGNTYSGYDYAIDMVNFINAFINTANAGQHLPNGTTGPYQPKSYSFVLDAVYFHQDEECSYPPDINGSLTPCKPFSIEEDSVLNIFLPVKLNGPGSGVAEMATITNPSNYGVCKQLVQADFHSWNAYKEFYRGTLACLWCGYIGVGTTIAHETGHNFTLLHATIDCKCNKIATDPKCGDDGFADTPSAFDMYAAFNRHPGGSVNQNNSGYTCKSYCGWNTFSNDSCSNNLMDYNSGVTLSNEQLRRIHILLEGGYGKDSIEYPLLKAYTVCGSVKNDEIYCNLPESKMAYYGKKVTIGGCTTSPNPITVHGKTASKKIFFTEYIDFIHDVNFKEHTLEQQFTNNFTETTELHPPQGIMPVFDALFCDCTEYIPVKN